MTYDKRKQLLIRIQKLVKIIREDTEELESAVSDCYRLDEEVKEDRLLRKIYKALDEYEEE